RRRHGLGRRPGRNRGTRRHFVGGGALGWNDGVLAHRRRARRWSALAGWRHHGLRRRTRGRALPLAWGRSFLFVLVPVLVLLVGLRLGAHARAAALDRLGVRQAARAGRKGKDTEESCQSARHCWSRIVLAVVGASAASPGGSSPLVSPVWGTKEAAGTKRPPAFRH